MHVVDLRVTGAHPQTVYPVTANFLQNLLSEHKEDPAPDIHQNLIAMFTTIGKTNQDTDKQLLTDISGNGNNFLVKNGQYDSAVGFGYGGEVIPMSSVEINPEHCHIDPQNNRKIIINSFQTDTWYVRIPVHVSERIITFRIDGVSIGNLFELGYSSPLQIDGSGKFEYEIGYDDLSEADGGFDGVGYIELKNKGTAPSGDVSIELISEMPDQLIIPRTATIECETIQLTNDFTIISEMRYSDLVDTPDSTVRDIIHIFGSSNLIQYQRRAGSSASKYITVGTNKNTFSSVSSERSVLLTKHIFNTTPILGGETIAIDVKNKVVIGGGTRLSIKNLRIYNKTLTTEEIHSEMSRYQI